MAEYQKEVAERLHLPFAILSDAELKLTRALRLPTFEVTGRLDGQAEGQTPAILLKRLTLVLRDGRIERLFYPVFPPDANADEVLGWLKSRR